MVKLLVSLILLGFWANPAAAGARRIILVLCGPVPAAVLDFLNRGLPQEFGAEVVVGGEIPLPAGAYFDRRRQYLGDAFLRPLPPWRQSDRDLVLGVTGVDLYVAGLNFVFGLADPQTRGAVISLARLDPEFYGQPGNTPLLQERALKEAVHELGHLLGLGHCADPSCIMFFSNSLADTDRKGPKFCDACRRLLTP